MSETFIRCRQVYCICLFYFFNWKFVHILFYWLMLVCGNCVSQFIWLSLRGSWVNSGKLRIPYLWEWSCNIAQSWQWVSSRSLSLTHCVVSCKLTKMYHQIMSPQKRYLQSKFSQNGMWGIWWVIECLFRWADQVKTPWKPQGHQTWTFTSMRWLMARLETPVKSTYQSLSVKFGATAFP